MNPPTQLRCEYLVNPLGLGDPRPRLSWITEDPARGARQAAYRIIVADSLSTLDAGTNLLWDSGRISSDNSVHIAYAGSPLRPGQRCFWKVRTWDGDARESAWSKVAFWEMGLLSRDEWKGEWIGSAESGGPYTPPPSPYLRKPITLDKPVARARLYVTALGLYEFEINGKLVSADQFLPGRTEYFKRVQYQVFDVASLLTRGENVLGVILGDGWYCGHLHSDPRGYYGDRPKFLAQLFLEFADGSTQLVVTDDSWRVTTSGPIRSSDILMGEDYDARMEIAGWSAPGFDDSAWQRAQIFPDPGIEIVATASEPVRRVQEIRPIAPPKISANKRRWIFDLGQNMVGRVRLKLRAPANKAGTTIDLRHAEMLDKDGKPYTTALRTARATNHYTIKGTGDYEIYEPRFTFHGFRYVEVRDVPGQPEPDTVTGIVLHSDAPIASTFECSDPMINQLQSNIVWSQRGNFLEIPTDCPQRDERLGWTGDAQVFIRTAAFNMDIAAFFTKWLKIMIDDQGEDGRIPSVVPHCPTIWGEGGPAWADAAVICPWTLYQCYGDRKILDTCWLMMSRFMDFLLSTSPGPDYLRPAEKSKWKGYGDWLSPPDAITPPELIGTAFYAYCAKLMSDIAAVTNRPAESARYKSLFDEVKLAWQRRFVAPYGQLIIQTQTAYVLALHFDLLPESQRPPIFDALLRDIAARDMHLSTGFVGTPYLNDVLTRFGRADIAYQLLLQKTYPSWLYPITQGATTMWERWDGWTPEKGFNDAGMNSYNHYAFGAIGAWLYSVVAGIDFDPARPGYKHILIRPTPGGDLTHARASLRSMYGTIESAWRLEGRALHLHVCIPANTTATIHIPTSDPAAVKEGNRPATGAAELQAIGHKNGDAVFNVPAGTYEFTAPYAPTPALAK